MTRQQMIDLIRRLSPDGVHGPTIDEYLAAKKTDPNMPCRNKILTTFGTWRQAAQSAGLLPQHRSGIGKKNSHMPTIEEIDADLYADLGWSPTDPHTLARVAYLPSEGLPVLPPTIKPIWDWRTMQYIQCEVYTCR